MSEPERPREPVPPPAAERPPSERRGRPASAVAFGVLLAAAGVVWLLTSLGAFDVSVEVWLGALLVLTGIGLLLLPAGARGPLVVIGVVLALAGAAASAVDVDVGGGVGERRERPRAPEELDDPYELGVGALRIDLRDLEVEQGDRLALEASVGIGELVVSVPEDASVEVDAHVDVGDVDALGERRSGLDVDLDERFDGDGPELILELETGIGSIKVVTGETP